MTSRHRLVAAFAALLLLVAAAALYSGVFRSAGPPAEATASLPDTGTVQTGALPDHDRFTRILADVVEMPRVDYARLKEERTRLDAYIAELADTSPATLESESDNARLAFWVNAYNACMLRLVIDHYPIEPGGTGLFGSIRNRVAGYPDNSVWQIPDVFSRKHCPVAGQDRSQDEIEHEIIRPRFDEPRIHFAVNCAAVSCPVLWPEAYEAETLDEQLDRAVNHFIDDPRHFRLEPGPPPVLTLNRVLDWYAEDFGGSEGLAGFFRPYLGPDRAELLTQSGLRIEYFEYDWTLNDTSQ